MAQYEVTLRDYWRILRRRKGIVLFTAFLLGFFSFIVSSIWQPVPIYKAEAKVQINTTQTGPGGLFQTISYGGAGDQLETQQAIITSFKVMERVAGGLGFLEFATTAEETARVVLSLPDRIETRQQGYTNIISIETTDPDPTMARDLANTVAETFRDYDHELKNQRNVKHRKFVMGQLQEARDTLQEAEEGVRIYRERTELISLQAQTSVTLQQITSTERLIQRFEGDLRGIDDMLEEMKGQKELSEEFMQGASAARVGQTFMGFSRQLNNLRLSRDALLVKYTESHPEVKQLDVKMLQLMSGMGDELRQRRQSVDRDLTTEQTRLARLRSEYKDLPTSGLELSRLEREVFLRQEVVNALEEQYQLALSREADKVEEVAILQWAIAPTSSTNPHPKLRRAFMGFVLGLLLGVVFAVVAETLDTSIGTIEDVQEYIGTQVVGVIPFIDVNLVRASLERRGKDAGDDQAVQRKAQLVSYFDPQSTLAETYRTLRTNIEFVTVEKEAKSLMVTSSSYVEGKSTTIANLAMSMAQLGKRTLLVDADMRKPSLARLFGLDKEPGLTEVIIGNNPWPETVRTLTDIVTGGMGLEDILQTQGISNLHIITSGTIPPNPAELLNSQRMTEFIGEVREEYDMVLFDSPPVLQVTDAAILGKDVEATLMVYKAGDIPRTSLKRSTDLLKGMEIEVLGVVLNGISADVSADYSDLGYNAYYAYGVDLPGSSVNIVERLQEAVHRWRSGNGNGNGSLGSDGEDQPRERDDAHPRRSPLIAALSYIALGLTALGFIWQSGYLKKPLGGIPVLEWYEERTSRSTDQISPVAALREVEDETAPEIALAEMELPEVEVETRTAAYSATQAAAPRPDASVVEVPQSEEAQKRGQAEVITPPAILTSAQRELDRIAAIEPRAENRVAGDSGTGDQLIESDSPLAFTIRMGSYPPLSKWALSSLEELRQHQEEAFLSPVKVRGQRLDRLLIGSFSTWDGAYRQARTLQQQGLIKDFVVLRLPYTIQLESYAAREKANQKLSDLETRGYSVYLQPTDDGSWRLLAGAFSSAQEARQALAALPGEMGRGKVAIR